MRHRNRGSKVKASARKTDLSMCPFFVIVHDTLLHWWRDRGQYREIRRIEKEEDFIRVEGRPQEILPSVPKGRKILVCGAMGTVCVAIQLGALRRAGYDAEIYKKATLY